MNTKPSEASPHDQSELSSPASPSDSAVGGSISGTSAPQPEPSATAADAGRAVGPHEASATPREPGVDTGAGKSAGPDETSSGGAGSPGAGSPGAGSPGSGTAGSGTRIQVGSRRDKLPQAPPSPRPKVTGADRPIKTDQPSKTDRPSKTDGPNKVEPPDVPRTPVRPPSVREPLSADLEREFAAAMGGASLDDIMSIGTSPQPMMALEPESRHRAQVVRVHGDNVFFTLGGRHEGVASLRQFPQPPELGSEMEVTVRRYSEEDGLYEVLIAGAAAQVDDWEDVAEGSVVEARITGANTGGLECRVGSLRGFIPSSQVAVFRVEDYAEYLDQKLLCVVTEVNPRRMNLVLSRRAVLEREKEEAREQMLKSLEVGQVMDGVVRKILDFGAFVDIGGVDGLVHISQLSWDHVNHPSEVLQEGQKIRVKIEKIDPQTGKIGLSHRELLEHPWLHIDEKFHADSVVTGIVSRIAKFGAFVKLAPGIEGLIHISELSHARVPSVGSVVAEGQEVQVKILSLDSESQRIALSMKAVLPVPVAEEPAAPEEKEEEAPAEPRDPVVAKRNTPLRGGMDRATGGDQFGLKW
ncbi:MAG: 30S ribosomal protein S1 [Pirellulaceae bacterium]